MTFADDATMRRQLAGTYGEDVFSDPSKLDALQEKLDSDIRREEDSIDNDPSWGNDPYDMLVYGDKLAAMKRDADYVRRLREGLAE